MHRQSYPLKITSRRSLTAHIPITLLLRIVPRDLVLAVSAPCGLLGIELPTITAAFGDEVVGEVVVALVAGECVEAEQRELDLGVAGVAVELGGPRAEGAVEKVDVFEYGVEEEGIFVVVVVD